MIALQVKVTHLEIYNVLLNIASYKKISRNIYIMSFQM